ncbi:RNA polymerase subunit sigma [Moritella sp. Urea-trap-13]|uniref:RNA polymerase subunit sigma n=1 Tax=Moritella sp. Urea-trap-13 TaxID=2058327 RepID=UPI000C347B97|nr:RNA polymerase subunit sigma [Moritella sp. Urea-trap-13]PKH05426.1 RNA polymerase subunit sigma [Moritella sp. Urea-trap-13]
MLLTRYLIKLLLTLSVTLFITACSTPRLFINNGLPIIASDAKFVLLPTDIHGLSGVKVQRETVFYTSFKVAFGKQIINTPQLSSRLKDNGFADVSWQMSHAMHRLVTDNGRFSYSQGYQLALANGDVNSKFRALDRDVYQLSYWLQQAYQLPVLPDYIVTAHIDSMGVSQAGRLLKYRVIAGIYSTEKKALERVVSYVAESPNQHKAILHDLDNLGFLIYRELFELH